MNRSDTATCQGVRCAAWYFRLRLKLNMPSLQGEMLDNVRARSKRPVAISLIKAAAISGTAPQRGPTSPRCAPEDERGRKDAALRFVCVPAAEDTASHPCPFDPSPVGSSGIDAGEAMRRAGWGDRVRPPAAAGRSRDCWPCRTAASAS